MRVSAQYQGPISVAGGSSVPARNAQRSIEELIGQQIRPDVSENESGN